MKEKETSLRSRNAKREILDLVKARYSFLLASLLLLIYFGYFVLPALGGRLNADDPMNIHYYWSFDHGGGLGLLKGLVLFFSTYYRPMAGVFFFTIYQFFGTNPLPYHFVIPLLLFL